MRKLKMRTQELRLSQAEMSEAALFSVEPAAVFDMVTIGKDDGGKYVEVVRLNEQGSKQGKKKNKLGISPPHKGPIAGGARVIVGAS